MSTGYMLYEITVNYSGSHFCIFMSARPVKCVRLSLKCVDETLALYTKNHTDELVCRTGGVFRLMCVAPALSRVLL